ncbi:hypothetical protein EXS70_01890 [Candidatus Peribacteria bacterium]|nr:hypothetical protein [Candidatus Peribacteria bacterium]
MAIKSGKPSMNGGSGLVPGAGMADVGGVDLRDDDAAAGWVTGPTGGWKQFCPRQAPKGGASVPPPELADDPPRHAPAAVRPLEGEPDHRQLPHHRWRHHEQQARPERVRHGGRRGLHHRRSTLASASWTTSTVTFSGAPTWTAGDTFLVKFKVSAKSAAEVHIGDLELRYVELLDE